MTQLDANKNHLRLYGSVVKKQHCVNYCEFIGGCIDEGRVIVLARPPRL